MFIEIKENIPTNRRYEMKYVLATTAKKKDGSIRKGAKRHIVKRSHDYFELKVTAKHINHDLYKVEIYNGRWQLVSEE